MAAGTWNITIEQGATFNKIIAMTDSAGAVIDLTGYSARMQIRQSTKSSVTLLELSSPSNGIAITALTGLITITISATTTAALSFMTAVYDLEIVNGSVVTRLLQGSVTLSEEVTR